MELIYDPQHPVHIVTWIFAVAVGLVMVTALLVPARRTQLARSFGGQLGIAACSIVAALALALATSNPAIVTQPEREQFHLAVLVDVSQSMTRPQGRWAQTRVELATLLDTVVDRLPAELRVEGSASLLVFSDGGYEIQPAPPTLSDLASRVRQIPEDVLPGNGSNLEAGLSEGGQRIADAGGRGAIVLFSDGWQTSGEARDAANTLAGRGIPVFVYPIQSEGSDVALIAADLARQTYAGERVVLRGTISNARSVDSPASIAVSLNEQLTDGSPRLSAAVRSPTITQTIAATTLAPLRTQIVFEGYGLQFADVTLTFDEGRGIQRRRFFTHVKRPLKLLAIGGDHTWQGAFAEAAATITSIGPGQLASAGDLRDYDAVVISAVAAEDFAAGELQSIAAAVKRDGVGLMLINGDHTGSTEEEATVLKSYEETPLASLLPLKAGPRPFEKDPPQRHVIFLIDTSGSMAGWPLEKAKEITANIIERLLRPEDTIDIIAFTESAAVLVKDAAMTPAAKEQAIKKLSTLTAGGGTDPSLALKQASQRPADDCGLIYLTDGGFDVVSERPECRATAFAIGGSGSPALAQLADPFPVDPSFDPQNIIIPYFQPERRNKLWEVGPYTAYTAPTQRASDAVLMPKAELLGNAVSHLRDDKAQMIAARPRLRDPVLAYQERAAGYVGTLATGIPAAWVERDETKQAIVEWIRRVAPYTESERYDFQVADDGVRMRLKISLLAKNDVLPNVHTVELSLQRPGEEPVEIGVGAEPGSPATFSAILSPERGDTAQEAVLILKEYGPDALPRPQRIPILIPPLGEVDQRVSNEAYSYGANYNLLTEIATTTGGRRLDQDSESTLASVTTSQNSRWPLWPALSLLAAAAYLIAILVRRLGR